MHNKIQINGGQKKNPHIFYSNRWHSDNFIPLNTTHTQSPEQSHKIKLVKSIILYPQPFVNYHYSLPHTINSNSAKSISPSHKFQSSSGKLFYETFIMWRTILYWGWQSENYIRFRSILMLWWKIQKICNVVSGGYGEFSCNQFMCGCVCACSFRGIFIEHLNLYR